MSRRISNGARDIVMYSKTGQEIRNLTNDEAIDNHPAWSPNGRYVYFTSDKGGVNNIYHNNGIQTWLVRANGETENVEIS